MKVKSKIALFHFSASSKRSRRRGGESSWVFVSQRIPWTAIQFWPGSAQAHLEVWEDLRSCSYLDGHF